MDNGMTYRRSPNNRNRNRTLTLTDSGLLHQALQERHRQRVRRRYQRYRAHLLRKAFTRDLDKNLQRFTGKTLAKLIYGMWRRGYFDRYDEFASARKVSAGSGA